MANPRQCGATPTDPDVVEDARHSRLVGKIAIGNKFLVLIVAVRKALGLLFVDVGYMAEGEDREQGDALVAITLVTCLPFLGPFKAGKF
jgi:hypothetical protein